MHRALQQLLKQPGDDGLGRLCDACVTRVRRVCDACATRVKSDNINASATENTIVPSTRLRINCWVVIASRVAAGQARKLKGFRDTVTSPAPC